MDLRPFAAHALAPTLIGAVLALQCAASLPHEAVVWGVLVLAAGLCGLARWRRAARWAGALALLAAALAVWGSAALDAAARLSDRLSPALEGVDLGLVGVVDELPVAVVRGERFGFRVEGCSDARASADPPDPTEADEVSGPVVGAASAVGRFTPRGAPGCVLPGRISLSWRADPRRPELGASARPQPAERWRFRVRLKRPHAMVNFGAFDRELRWLQEGIGAVGTVREGQRLEARVAGPGLAIERLRATLRDALFDAAGSDHARAAGVLAALAIGDQAAIDAAAWTVFNQTGVGHLMSISGLHITMLAGLGGALAALIWRSRPMARLRLAERLPVPIVRLAAAVSVGTTYALLAGWGIPARRTCFMLAAAALLIGSGRTASVVAAVGAAATAIVVLDPWAPLAAGFWLSFAGVLALVWADGARRFDESRLVRVLRGAVRAQWAATVALLPLGAWFFASVSWIGPLANAIAIPLVSGVITPLALIGAAVAFVSPEWAAVLVVPTCALVDLLTGALAKLAEWPLASASMPRPGLAALVIASAGAALLLAPRGVPGRACGALALLPLALVPLPRPPAGELRLTALDVGQGTTVVVQIEAHTLIYDTGPSLGPGQDTGSRTIVPWLRSQGIGRPDLLVVSHLDDDHAGGALSLIRATPPRRLASSLPEGHPIVAAVPQSERCRRGEGWRWADASFDWLHPADPPERSRGSPSNAVSCVLRIRHPGGTVLLTGDIEAAQERRLTELYGDEGLAADVLVVPHHGSLTSSTEGFLDAVAPRWAIVQAAYLSRYRHPHPRVVERYQRRGVVLLRSDADGAVQMRLRAGAQPVIVRARHEPARYWRLAVDP
jgi:competence protein ComEC